MTQGFQQEHAEVIPRHAVDMLDRCMLCGRSDESIDLDAYNYTGYASANCNNLNK